MPYIHEVEEDKKGTLPDQSVVRQVHVVVRSEPNDRDTPFGVAKADALGPFRVAYRGHHV